MAESNLPSYIYRSGGFLERPSFHMKDTQMYAFFVKGDKRKLQKLVDTELNALTTYSEKYQFKVLSDHIMLSFADIQHCYSDYPADYQKGYGPEVDVCFWVPVANVVNKEGKTYVKDVFWYTPYIWVDSPIAMVAGRDIYGYPKTMGQFELPSPEAPNLFTAKVNSFKTFSPDTEAAWNNILSVNNLTPNESPIEQWDDAIDAFKGIYDTAKSLLDIPVDWQGLQQMFELLLKPQIPQLFLKQFPDATGQYALYQGLISAPAKVSDFKKGGVLLGNYQLNIEQVDSIPLAETLGLSIGSQDIAFGFWLNFDFYVPAGKELVNNSQLPPKEKIAILGGGVSACTAAFALTNQPGWQDRYDITLYQQGWRLGGKGASGRNAKMGQRIEEHGLHIWLGFYRNAFRVMQQAYAELGRPAGSPLATWEEAFKPHNFIVFMEHIDEEWIPWCIDFPVKAGNPAEGDEGFTAWQLTTTLYAWIRDWLGDLKNELDAIESATTVSTTEESENFRSIFQRLSDWVDDELDEFVDDVQSLAKQLADFVSSLPETLLHQGEDKHRFLHAALVAIKTWLAGHVEDLLDENHELRRLYISIDLGLAILTGMLEDDVFEKGFNSINHIEFREWLLSHGANPDITVNAAPVRALYDLIFAYRAGDIHDPNVEAGTCLRGMLRMIVCYKGAIMWKMQAGMGDVVFTPFYQVLKKRGVKFQFFNEVEKLSLSPEQPNQVQEIHIRQQLTLTDGAENYYPLVNVKGLNCWPSEPNYEQVLPKQAQLLQQEAIDLEDFWSNWPEVYQQNFGEPLPVKVLQRGSDFDTVIHGMSIAGLGNHAEELLAHSSVLRACYEQLETVVTQAYQLWTLPNLPDLGWLHYSETGQQPIMTSWTEPVDTWAAMNQLLDKEDWSQMGLEPENCAYFCGVQPISEFPPRSDHGFPVRSREQVKEACLQQLSHEFYALWPNSATPSGFQWSNLLDPDERLGPARFDAQYWRSNVSPSERYVQSVVGSSDYRIDSKLDDFDNLYFTGDWIKTGINAGCVEAAVMAGLQTSRAIAGYPLTIAGEHDFENPDLS